MLDSIWNKIKGVAQSRLFPVSIIFFILFFLLIRQIFILQIIEGQTYQNQSIIRDEKLRYLKSTRGNIYDRALTKLQSYRIGVCFQFQLLPHIPVEATDLPMDEVWTEQGCVFSGTQCSQ